MDWNLNIPKRIYFYWGGDKLSFIRFMSIYSFKKLNPDWDIFLYNPLILNNKEKWAHKQYENRSNIIDYTNMVSSLLGIKPVIFDFEKVGLSNHMNEVHKSDFIRYYLLSEFGGVWADMDVLFIKPMTELYHNKVSSSAKTFYYYDGKGVWQHGIGFLMADKGSQYFTDVFNEAKSHFDETDYQSIGADLLNSKFKPKVISSKYPDTVSLDTDSVYCINHDHYPYLYSKNGKHMITEDAVGIHWYGGSMHVGNLTLSVNHKNLSTYDNEGTVMLYMKELFGDDFKDL